MKKFLIFCLLLCSGAVWAQQYKGPNAIIPSAPYPAERGVPHRSVTFERTWEPHYKANPPWVAYGPDGKIICRGSNNGYTAGKCLQAAVNYAFPYASGTLQRGYEFNIIGGDDPAQGLGHNYGGAATGIYFPAGGLKFPPIQGGTIRIGSISAGASDGSIIDGLVFDSLEMVTVDACHGSQIEGVHFKPTLGTPIDNGATINPAHLCFQTINGRVRFDLSGSASANYGDFFLKIAELNADGSGTSDGRCVIEFDSPAAGQNAGGMNVNIRQIHFDQNVPAALCMGRAVPGVGAVFGQSSFDVGIYNDGPSGTAVGVSTYGSGDFWIVHSSMNGSSGADFVLESGACGNEIHIFSARAYSLGTTFKNNSGCTNNSVWWNGVEVITGS